MIWKFGKKNKPEAQPEDKPANVSPANESIKIDEAAIAEVLPEPADEVQDILQDMPSHEAAAVIPDEPTQEQGWFSRMREGLSKSSSKLTENIGGIFTQRTLDDALLEELEEALIMADLGVETASRLTQNLAKEKFDKNVTELEVREHFAQQITDILQPVVQPLTIDKAHKPFVITMVGVNGTGKTTTIGKLARQWLEDDYKVVVAAADTFRAAAVEQLQVWGERAGCPVIVGGEGADPASVAYQGIEQARSQDADILVVDTAGRLQNKQGLMEELKKIHRVITKQDEFAPHATILVLDATTGQNAHSQVEIFNEMVNVTGLVITKLDGTAKGGVVVALAEKYGLPIHAIGVGESIEDLQSFNPQDFARSLMGLERA